MLFRDQHDDQGCFEATGEFPNVEQVDLPVSPDAIRHKRCGPSLLYRYLPFWVATAVEWFLIIAVPLLVVVLPVVPLLPAVMRRHVRSRIYLWYGELKLLERDVKLRSGTLPIGHRPDSRERFFHPPHWRPSVTMTRLQCLAACLLLLNWSPAMAIDEPGYTVVRTDDAFEVRRYEPYIVAETVVNAAAEEAGNQGFRILAGYIFGQNKGARKIEMTAPVVQTPTKIAMTAPVAQSATSDGYVVQFAMPREWTLETLPEPTDPRVNLRAIPARTLAVISYSGTWSQANYEENLKKLQDALAKAGVKWHGAAVWARYDPPWKPWFWRRNEILLELD